jgi:hypothetical protein
MGRRTWRPWPLWLAVPFLAGLAGCGGPAGKVDLKVIALADLESTVQQLRGQVVVLEFWGEF